MCGIWKFSEAFEFYLNLNSTWHSKFVSDIPDKYLFKSMRGANMTLQQCQKKILPKGLNSKFEFYLEFAENVFILFLFCLWKNVRVVGFIFLILLIYIFPIVAVEN